MISKHSLSNTRIGVIGLGYVGLPLAVEFGKKRDVIGFDVDVGRIEALKASRDSTLEVSEEEIRAANRVGFTCELADLADCNVYIVTVPTPIDAHKRPDLTHLIKASYSVGKVLKVGDIVIYQSTVYPGFHPRGLCSNLGASLWPDIQQGFFRWLQSRAHQPRRQAPSGGDDQEGHFRLDFLRSPSSSTPSMLKSSPRGRTRRRASRSPKLRK